MPHTTSWELSGIYWQFSGRVDIDEIRRADNEFYGDARFDSVRYFIWDALNIEQLFLTDEDIEIPAALDQASSTMNPHIFGAFVVDDPEIRRSVEHYIQVTKQFGSPWTFAIFSSVEAARATIQARLMDISDLAFTSV